MFTQLFILTSTHLNSITKLKKQYPDSRTLVWDETWANEEILKYASEYAEIIVVEDTLYQQINRSIEKPIKLISQYAPHLNFLSSKIKQNTKKSLPTASEGKFSDFGSRPVVFCPSNDTHVMMFSPIANYLNPTKFLLFDTHPSEKAESMLKSTQIPYEIGNYRKLFQIKPTVVVVGNDWHKESRKILDVAHFLRIPTVCIQEGCLDFETNQRMKRCTYPFIQGPIMVSHLVREIYFLTGNPRFDAIQPLPLPKEPVIMVNCNFTYNIHENIRESWINEVVEACKTIGVDFFISRHPRDTGEFPGLPVRKSGADVIHNQLTECTVLVSRFSTTIYEAMRLGRQVIYYNPHKETMRLFNEDETGGIYKAYDQAELSHALSKAINPITPEQKQKFQNFVELHCGNDDGRSAYRCASALVNINKNGYPLPLSETIPDTIITIISRLKSKIAYELTHR